jgi:spore coat polysaccharide biosynthesis predicted glycosyltransferase SpsG/RimJ/RimL family protein N-acetyltransferase
MKIGFRLDASQKIGMGHYSRCLSLAEVALSAGHAAIFIVQDLPSTLRKNLQAKGIPVFNLGEMPESSSEDNEIKHSQSSSSGLETLEAAKFLQLDILVIDIYQVDDQWVPESLYREFKILQIADFPAIKGVDMILDYGFDASPEKHKNANVPPSQMFLGPIFAPIRTSFLKLSGHKSSSPDLPNKKVLIALGSALPNKIILQLLADYSAGMKVYNLEIVGQIHTSHGDNRIQITSDSDGLSQQMHEAAFVLTSGGVTLYERLAMGKPGLVIETAPNQSFSLGEIRRICLTKVIRLAELINGKELLDLVDSGISDEFQEHDKLSLQKRVDFFGSLRIAYKLGLLSPDVDLQKRYVAHSDIPILLRWVNDASVRQSAFSSVPIDEQSHLEWFAGLEARGSKRVMFSMHQIPLGQVRFDRIGNAYLLDYSLDSMFRGLGLANQMVMEAIDFAGISSEVWAYAKASNQASVKTLLKSGFSIETEDDNKIKMVLRLGD